MQRICILKCRPALQFSKATTVLEEFFIHSNSRKFKYFLKWVVRDAHCTEMKKTLLTCLAWMVVLTSPAQTQ
jgi:hypothetical protein